MITYKEYMENSGELHHAYWLEVATEAGLQIPKELLEACRNNLRRDGRSHFNSTPMLAWDELGLQHKNALHRALKPRGTGWSLSCGACAGKALARHLLDVEGYGFWWATDTITWFKITQDRFDDMLGALPPRIMEGGGFLLGEADSHVETGTPYPEERYRAFVQIGARCFEASRPLTLYQFRSQIYASSKLKLLREKEVQQ